MNDGGFVPTGSKLKGTWRGKPLMLCTSGWAAGWILYENLPGNWVTLQDLNGDINAVLQERDKQKTAATGLMEACDNFTRHDT